MNIIALCNRKQNIDIDSDDRREEALDEPWDLEDSDGEETISRFNRRGRYFNCTENDEDDWNNFDFDSLRAACTSNMPELCGSEE